MSLGLGLLAPFTPAVGGTASAFPLDPAMFGANATVPNPYASAVNPALTAGLQQVAGTLPPVPTLPSGPLDPSQVLAGTQVPYPNAPPADTNLSILPFAQVGGQPFDKNMVTALQQYQKKYSTLLPQLQQAGVQPQYLNALLQLDSGRVQRGSAPLTTSQTINALNAAITNRAVTPAKHTSWWDLPVNAFHDLSNIVESIPHIPAALINTAEHFGDIPGDISKALATPGGIGAEAQALAQVPGINLVPGVHTLADVVSGHFSDIATHPVSTFLDVLPLAHQLGVGAALADSAVGEAARTTSDALASTKLGQIGSQLFGAQSRELSIMANGITHNVLNAMDPAVASSDILDNLAKDSMKWAQQWHADLTPQRVAYLTDAAERGTYLQDPTVTPTEMSAISDYRDIVSRYAQYGVDHQLLTQQPWLGGQEVFTPDQAQNLLRGRDTLARFQAFTPVANAIRAAFAPLTSDARVSALADTPDAIRGLVDNARDLIGNERVTGNTKAALLQGIGHAYNIYGYALPDTFKSLVNGRQYADAYNLLDRAPITRLASPPPPDQLAVTPWLTRANRYTDANLSRMSGIAAAREVRFAPARWSPVVEDALRSRVGQALTDRGYLVTDSPDFARLQSYVSNGMYNFVIKDGLITPAELNTWMAEAQQAVTDAKAAGIDPLFMHRVGMSQMGEVNFPRPLRTVDSGYTANPSQLRARTLNTAPYVHDLSVGLTHQGLEWLNQRNANAFLKDFLRTTPQGDEVVAPFAKSYQSLFDQYSGSARAQRLLTRNPSLDFQTAVESAIRREWTQYKVEQLPDEVKQALGVRYSTDPNAPWLPKPIYNNLRLFINEPQLPRAFDAPTSLFRNAVLGFSPRFLLNHLVGGMVLTSAQTSPLAVMKYLREAIDMTRAARAGDPEGLLASMPETMRNAFGSVRDPLIEWNVAHGGKLADLWQQAQDKSSIVRGATGAASTLMNKSYDTVSLMSDAYRAINYLYGRDQAVADGLTATQAARAGEELARRTIVTFDQMTPLERVTMKSIFPFYGFTQQIMRYAFHYPIDHPFRASVTASVARMEMHDLGTGLPQSLLGSFFLGHPDANGNVNTIHIGSLNPFKDVANYMTLMGWLKSTNPVISTVLQQAGVDVQSGGTNLYPNIAYDPNTGKLTASHPNPLTNFLYNTIPQTQLLTGLLDKGSELHTLMAADPQAGVRLALAQAALPALYQQVNVPQQVMKAELNRETAQTTALSAAVKSGNWRAAAAYPGLQAPLGQLAMLQQDQLLGHWNTGEQIRQMQQLIEQTINGNAVAA